MEVAVDRSLEIAAQNLRGLEIQLPPAEKVHVQRVEVGRIDGRLESDPAPPGNPAGQRLRAALIADVAQLDRLLAYGTSINAASGAMRWSVWRNPFAREMRSLPTFMIGTISQSGGSAASRPAREYVMPPIPRPAASGRLGHG